MRFSSLLPAISIMVLTISTLHFTAVYASEEDDARHQIQEQIDHFHWQSSQLTPLPPEHLPAYERGRISKETVTLSKQGRLFLLYGGPGYKTFLGCLNCSPKSYISLWNPHSPFGNTRSDYSIWNHQCFYGNPLSNYSPWARYGSYAPLIVDNNGKFYGFLSVNEHNEKRNKSILAEHMYNFHDVMRHNLEAWFSRLFSRALDPSKSVLSDPETHEPLPEVPANAASLK